MLPAVLKRLTSIFIWVLMITSLGCAEQNANVAILTGKTPTAAPTLVRAAEADVILLRLGGPINKPQAEISGLAWFDDVLILLPQYPGRFTSPLGGSLFGIHKDDLIQAVQAPGEVVLTPFQIPFEDGKLSDSTSGFEGFEAVAFLGDQMYLTVESSQGGKMKAHLVRGKIESDLSGAKVDASTLHELPVQSNSPNKSYESLLVIDQAIYAIYEVNGERVNPAPVMYRFADGFDEPAQYPFPVIEFRVTDASEVDADGTFWVMNYFYPGDVDLFSSNDALAELYGMEGSHEFSDIRERLVAVRIVDDEIIFDSQAPIYLKLLEDTPRNWEGLARLDDLGLLVATDKFPETMLGFVAFP